MKTLLQRVLLVLIIVGLLAVNNTFTVLASAQNKNEVGTSSTYPSLANGVYQVTSADQLPKVFFLWDSESERWYQGFDPESLFYTKETYKMVIMDSLVLVVDESLNKDFVNATKVYAIHDKISVQNPKIIYIGLQGDFYDTQVVIDGKNVLFARNDNWVSEYDHVRPAKIYRDGYRWIIMGQQLDLKDPWIFNGSEEYPTFSENCGDLKDRWQNYEVSKSDVKKHCGLFTWAQEYGAGFEGWDDIQYGSFAKNPSAYINIHLADCGITSSCGATLPAKELKIRAIVQVEYDDDHGSTVKYWSEIWGPHYMLDPLSSDSTTCIWLYGQDLSGVYAQNGTQYVPPADVCFIP